VKLKRQLPVGALNLLVRGARLDAQDVERVEGADLQPKRRTAELPARVQTRHRQARLLGRADDVQPQRGGEKPQQHKDDVACARARRRRC
jgi:hypothetical protein